MCIDSLLPAGAAWVIALKQFLQKKWEQTRDMWNLVTFHPYSYTTNFLFVFV
jgi:ubiquinone biosynthesis protein Coq4